MADPKAYPVPDRQRWNIMVQFLDGTQIVGASEEEVIDRWRGLGFWAVGRLPRGEFQARVAAYARVEYGAGLIGIGADTPPQQFLDALDAEGVVSIVRKG